jgi:alpha-amylase/alpha-mannosidase (GH57 family)
MNKKLILAITALLFLALASYSLAGANNSSETHAKLYVVFLWHMHQPPYVLPNGTALAPWPRLWVTKGYYPMVALALAEHAHVTFDFTPTLLEQIEMVAEGKYDDPYLQASEANPYSLSDAQKLFILERFFDAAPIQIERYPRYYCLYQEVRQNGVQWALSAFTPQDYLDLQTLFNLAWYNAYILERDPQLRPIYLYALNSNCTTHFTVQQRDLLLAGFQKYAERLLELIEERGGGSGSLEIVTTPMYYPIMPLVINLTSALQSNPYLIVPPTGFSYPQDVYRQLLDARSFYGQTFGFVPRGLWPPEMAVSQAALELIAEAGFNYTFISGYTLALTLGRQPGVLNYVLWYVPTGYGRLYVLARDDGISNYIGFGASGDVNSRGPFYAANKTYWAIKSVQEQLERAGVRKGVVLIALDGENPFQYFNDDGVQYLTYLYRLIKDDKSLKMVTAFEAVQALKSKAELLRRPVVASTWAGDFSTWVGNWEQNLAWTILYNVRQDVANWTCMYEAEAGDWFFWYSGYFASATPYIFDDLFRAFAQCAAAQYNYTWPLSTPIYFSSDAQIGWAGSPFERIVTVEGPYNFGVQIWSPNYSPPSPAGAQAIRAILHFGPVNSFGGPWTYLYFVPMNFSGVYGNNYVYTATVYLKPGNYEFIYIAQGQNTYYAHASSTADGNYWITVLPTPTGSVQDAYVYQIRVYNNGGYASYSPAAAPGCVYAPAGSTVGVVVAVKSSGTVYPVLHYGYGSWWWPVDDVLAQPVGSYNGYTLYEANVTLPSSGIQYVFEIFQSGGTYWVNVGGANGEICAS